MYFSQKLKKCDYKVLREVFKYPILLLTHLTENKILRFSHCRFWNTNLQWARKLIYFGVRNVCSRGKCFALLSLFLKWTERKYEYCGIWFLWVANYLKHTIETKKNKTFPKEKCACACVWLHPGGTGCC